MCTVCCILKISLSKVSHFPLVSCHHYAEEFHDFYLLFLSILHGKLTVSVSKTRATAYQWFLKIKKLATERCFSGLLTTGEKCPC